MMKKILIGCCMIFTICDLSISLVSCATKPKETKTEIKKEYNFPNILDTMPNFGDNSPVVKTKPKHKKS